MTQTLEAPPQPAGASPGRVGAAPPPPAPRELPADLSTLGSLMRPDAPGLILAIVLGAVAAIAALGQPLAVGALVSAITSQADLTPYVLVLSGLFLLDAGLGAAQGYVVGRSGESTVLRIRTTLASMLVRSTVASHRGRAPGDVLARTVNDAALVKNGVIQSLAVFVVSGIMLIGGMVITALLDLTLFGLTFAILIGSGLLALLISRGVKSAAGRQRQAIGDFATRMQRMLSVLTTVKTARAEDREVDALADAGRSAYRAGLSVTLRTAMVSPVVSVGLQVAFAVVIVVGISRVTAGDLGLGDFTAFVLYLFYLVTPLVAASIAMATLQQGRAAHDRLRGLAELPVEHLDASPGGGADHAANQAGDPVGTETGGDVLALNGVCVNDAAGRPILDHAALALPRRGLTAIVGASGSGKSTLVQTAVRFVDADAGRIRLDGRDITGMSVHELRGRVALVEQEPALLEDTLRRNIALADPGVSDERLLAAIDAAQLGDVVARCEHGLDTVVGDAGVRLSGGERQRVALARVLLADPDVLLLDEITAQLDEVSAAALLSALVELSQVRSVTVVTHRLPMASRADQVVVLDAGRVVGSGRHDDLRQSNNAYRELLLAGGLIDDEDRLEPIVPETEASDPRSRAGGPR